MIKMYIGLYVKYRCSCEILMRLVFSRDIFVKILNVKFLENPSSGSQVVPFERPDRQTDRWTHTTKLIFTFRNFVNQPEK
jgi:hypothetical protein